MIALDPLFAKSFSFEEEVLPWLLFLKFSWDWARVEGPATLSKSG